jgi:hypothetical protein
MQTILGASGTIGAELADIERAVAGSEVVFLTIRDYVFDSSKFEARFAFKPTAYLDGVRALTAGSTPGPSNPISLNE